MEKSRERNSSLELLRIFAMLMIIAHHFAVHGGFNFLVNSVTINRLWYQFILMGNLGNNLFLFITGYFLVKSPGLKFLKLFNFWIKLFFYSVLFFYLFVFLGLENFSWKEAFGSLMLVPRTKWWFATTYFALYLIHPYLNILLNNLSREEYKKFLILIFTCWSIIPTLTSLPFEGSRLLSFVCLYSLAAYFRLWGQDFGNKKFIFYGIGFLLLNFLLTVSLDFAGLKIPALGTYASYFSGMMSPLSILWTLFLFLGFLGLNIKNKFINLIGAATFGVYLIHEDMFIRPFLWFQLFKNASFQDSPYLIPYSIFVVILVFIVCTLIEILRSKIFRLISRGRLS